MRMGVMRVVSASHYFHRIERDADGAWPVSLPSLDAATQAVTRERYRRIDRFVQLALLGAGTCVRDQMVRPDCGLYLASGIGPIGSNVQVQDAIQIDRKAPMPFSFVNTLGSSAAYHVAKDLGLAGEAVLVARAGGSFSAALRCAMTDIAEGVVTQVLIGAVEECILPADRQRALLRQGPEIAVAEGSHWVLLERGDAEGAAVPASALADATFDGYEARDAAELVSYVLARPFARFEIAPSRASRVEGWSLVGR